MLFKTEASTSWFTLSGAFTNSDLHRSSPPKKRFACSQASFLTPGQNDHLGKSPLNCAALASQSHHLLQKDHQYHFTKDAESASGTTHKLWTDGEDELVIVFHRPGVNDWNKVSRHVPGRSAGACAARWFHFLKGRNQILPSELWVRRGQSWTSEEDQMLASLFKEGGTTNMITKAIPTRSEAACRIRWHKNRLQKPLHWADQDHRSTRKGRRWTEKEERILSELVSQGEDWKVVAQEISGREPRTCQTHWFHMRRAKRNGIRHD